MTNVQGHWSNLSFMYRKHQASHVSCKTQTSHHRNPADVIGSYTRNEKRLRDVKALVKAMPKQFVNWANWKLFLLCFKLVEIWMEKSILNKEGEYVNVLNMCFIILQIKYVYNSSACELCYHTYLIHNWKEYDLCLFIASRIVIIQYTLTHILIQSLTIQTDHRET